MKIDVKFMGTFGLKQPGHRQLTTSVLKLPGGSCVKDLFDHYKIPMDREYAAIIHGRVAKPDDTLSEGMVVSLFQAAYGG